jgi:1-acyl-sn-glycerol-3-phosphate acyltransferase
MERACFEAVDRVHRSDVIQAAVQPFQRVVSVGWVTATTGRLRRVHGLEHLRALDPDRGVVFVSNHRSFFDFYVISAVLYRNAPWLQRVFFPVRSSFFYEGPLGVLVNAVMSGGAMFPPVLRDEARRGFNRYTTDFVVDALRARGTVVGYHPEGTRSKGDDPYALLPALPGIGTILHRARPIVVPVFTLGLINNFPKQIWSNYDGTGAPVTMVFGPPMDLTRFDALPDAPETWRVIADAVRAELVALGEVERAFRAAEGLPAL